MNRKRRIVITSILVLIFIVSLIHQFIVSQSPTFYTIGKVERIYRPLRQSPRAVYSYNIGSDQYRNSSPQGRLEIGKCYLVEVPKDYIREGQILSEYPVLSDCKLGEVWDEIPSRFKAMKVEQ